MGALDRRVLGRPGLLAARTLAPAARRWYNPMHVAKQKPKPHEARAARPSAPSAPSTSAPAAEPVAAWPPTEARTLGDLIKMQQSGLPAMLPASFLEHARAVRTYDGSAAKVRAATETPPSLSAQPRESAPAPDFTISGSASAAASIFAALAGAARQPPSPSQSRRNNNGTEQNRQREPTAPSSALSRVASFDLRPRELVALLDRYVVRQSEAKRVLAVAVCDHYNHARSCLLATRAQAAAAASNGGKGTQVPDTSDLEHSKPNVLLLGSTGVGKTYLMRTLAKLIGVPFVRADATKFTATGYVGRDPEDLLRDLLPAAGGDLMLAQHGIVYVDEIDKLCTPIPSLGGGGGGGGNIHTRDVQNNFLKLLEDTDVPLEAGAHSQQAGGRRARQSQPGHGGSSNSAEQQPTTLSTKHVLFIFSGAFSHVPALSAPPSPPERSESDSGANGATGGRSWNVETAALVAAGLEPELVGRLPVRVRCEQLDEAALLEILTNSRGSALRQMERELSGYGVRLTVTEGALKEVAKRASAEGTGARGLLTVLEGVLRPFKFELPSTDVTELLIDEATVMFPDETLAGILAEFEPRRHLLLQADVERHAARAGSELGLGKVTLAECARDALVTAAMGDGRCAREVCVSRLEPALAKMAAEAEEGVEREEGVRVTVAMLTEDSHGRTMLA